MLGSLNEFMSVSTDQCFKQISNQQLQQQNIYNPQKKYKNKIYHRQRSSMSQYTPQDKSQLLKSFGKNHQQYIISKNKNKIQNKNNETSYRGKSPYQHSSFFVKQQILKDYISKDTLQRKHNLLRAIVRSKQDDQKTNEVTDYDQAFQRMVSGYSQIYVKPGLKLKQSQKKQIHVDINRNLMPQKVPKKKNLFICQKIIQYNRCKEWAKKHKKDFSYYDKKLEQTLDKKAVEQKQSERRQYMSELTHRMSEFYDNQN